MARAPPGSRARVIGGEYVEDPTVPAANRLRNAPFVWIATAPGPESLDPGVGGSHHNPYVKPSVVAQLLALGQQ